MLQIDNRKLFIDLQNNTKKKKTSKTKNLDFFCLYVYFFLVMEGRTKKNGPTQSENRLGFPGELIEFNHSLAGLLFSRFLLVGLFSFLVQKKENI
jgi:hypothetical protein